MGVPPIGRTRNNAKPASHPIRSASQNSTRSPIAMSEGGSVMAIQRPASNVTSRYDDFLFAWVWDEPGGMRLSVVSALARMNLDPWEEAARLTALPARDAERALVSTLSLLPGHPQLSPETGILAARLVSLLPKARAAATAKVATLTASHEQQPSYWLVWLCIALAISFPSSPRPATKTGAAAPASTSNAAPPAESRSAAPAPSEARRRADPVSTIPPRD
jgi:hypothetical protein